MRYKGLERRTMAQKPKDDHFLSIANNSPSREPPIDKLIANKYTSRALYASVFIYNLIHISQ